MFKKYSDIWFLTFLSENVTFYYNILFYIFILKNKKSACYVYQPFVWNMGDDVY